MLHILNGEQESNFNGPTLFPLGYHFLGRDHCDLGERPNWRWWMVCLSCGGPPNGLMIAEMTFYGTKMIYQSVEGNEVMQSLIVSSE